MPCLKTPPFPGCPGPEGELGLCLRCRNAKYDAAMKVNKAPVASKDARAEVGAVKLPVPQTLLYAYRGEDPETNLKAGRTPAQLKGHGGFKPWQVKDVQEARQALATLAANGTLEAQAKAWCLSKNKENGWFFSTGTSAGAAYDNYAFLYRVTVSAMIKRQWNTVGLAKCVNVDSMHLYTDQPTINASTQIGVIWDSAGRTGELLIMTPIAAADIKLKQDGQFKDF